MANENRSNARRLRPAGVHAYGAVAGHGPGAALALIVGREGWLEALAFQPLALQLPGAAHRLGGLTGSTLGRLFVMPPQLHFAENTLPLHLLFERLERLIDVVITHEDLHLAACSYPGRPRHRVRKNVRRQGFRRGGWRYNMAVGTYKLIFR